MNIFKELKDDFCRLVDRVCPQQELLEHLDFDIPKDPLHGDISTNIAMVIASKNKKNPRELALQFKECLINIPYVAHIEVLGLAFINFTIKAEKWHKCLLSMLKNDSDFWSVNIGKGEKINIEYVSANPTGPIHIGHVRVGIYGDVLSNILKKCKFNITKEFYVNDSGGQIDRLVDSVILRYKEIVTGEEVIIPDDLYQGEYLKTIGYQIAKDYNEELLSKQHTPQVRALIKKITIQFMLDLIKNDLTYLGIKYDVFFSEQYLHDRKMIDQTIDILKERDLVYYGVLPPPKGKVDNSIEKKSQMLFRSTLYGDDQDRAITKSDGAWSYLAADIAYAKNKIDRGYSHLIYVLGADHTGYIKRVKAIIKALGKGKVKNHITTIQLVNFVKNRQVLKMSKRNGNFITISDVIKKVDKDIIRFIMLTRHNNAILDFDLVKVQKQSKDNPVFYVQYAHVRAVSILATVKESMPECYEKFVLEDFDLSLLITEEEIQLIKLLAVWPQILTLAAIKYEPQKIVHYLIELAYRFHSIWSLRAKNNDYRFIVEDDEPLTRARLALVEAIRRMILCGFEIIGITPMNKM